MYCRKCGAEVMDEAVICPKCGCFTSEEFAKKMSTRNSSSKKSSASKKSAAEAFMIFTCFLYAIIFIFCIILLPGQYLSLVFPSLLIILIPLAWTIPMTVIYYKRNKQNKSVGIAFKICTLFFVNTISGILMLCDKD